ncbi:MAG TPA: DUF885 domain-containing protein [Kofleriaceae bacterium]|nr:DUF885 domain-containing protein [Kofleriaceae bacterium]
MGCATRLAALAVAAAACGPRAPSGAGAGGGTGSKQELGMSPLGTDAIKGVTDEGLRALLLEHWEWLMQTSPVWATTLGDHRFDDQLDDGSAAAIAAERARRRDFLARAEKLPRASMSRADQITFDLFTGQIKEQIAVEVCELHQWLVSSGRNPVTDFNILPEQHIVKTPADGANLLARYRSIPRRVDEQIGHLRDGASKGLYADAESLRRTIDLVDGQLATDLDRWALVRPAQAPRPGWSAEARERFARDVRQVVGGEIKKAFQRYRALLADEILPHARGADRAGIGHMPNGKACYAARVLFETSMALDPEQLHRTGVEEIERINGEMVALGGKLFGRRASRPAGGKPAIADILRILREDRSLYYRTADEVVAGAQAALDAARGRIPDFFGRLPRADCVVARVPEFEAPYTTIAYYREPHVDGSKPGEYFINTFKPEVRPRFEMPVLSFHESIPGHHLQIAIAQELTELPAFRRFLGSTAFVEGWALYTERLADEMGLYASDLDRMGMLSYDAWRASRLVVDTGIHLQGWTRARAEQYMREHTALTLENIRNEVDRYISWPGQALAYKVGQLEIIRLRREAEAALGPRFDIKGFHDTVLASGAVTLPVLQGNVAAWVAARKSAP